MHDCNIIPEQREHRRILCVDPGRYHSPFKIILRQGLNRIGEHEITFAHWQVTVHAAVNETGVIAKRLQPATDPFLILFTDGGKLCGA